MRDRDEVAVVIVHTMTQTGVVEAGVSRRISAWKPERGAAACTSFVAHEFSDRPSVGQRRRRQAHANRIKSVQRDVAHKFAGNVAKSQILSERRESLREKHVTPSRR